MAGRLENPVIVAGFTELERDLKATSPKMLDAMRVGLEKGSQKIRRDAGTLSRRDISGMNRAKVKPPPWSVQKIGQNTKEVYMVPVQKGKRRGRTDGDRKRAEQFKKLMLGRSYEPALERNRVQLVRQVDLTIGIVTKEFNGGG